MFIGARFDAPPLWTRKASGPGIWFCGNSIHPHLWVADMTYVSTWSGFVYAAFVVDAYSRRIVGWRTSTSMTSSLVLDAIEHAIWTRQRDGIGDLHGLVQHHDRGSQYTSIAYTERLAAASISPSVGRVGDSYDNAVAETINGLYKTELIKPRGPWRTVDQVEVAPWNGWTGSTIAASTATAPIRHPPNTKSSTTVSITPSTPLSSQTHESPDSPGDSDSRCTTGKNSSEQQKSAHENTWSATHVRRTRRVSQLVTTQWKLVASRYRLSYWGPRCPRSQCQ